VEADLVTSFFLLVVLMGVRGEHGIHRDYWRSASAERDQSSQCRSAFSCCDWSYSKKADDIEKEFSEEVEW